MNYVIGGLNDNFIGKFICDLFIYFKFGNMYMIGIFKEVILLGFLII